jgi:hypothetical protein
MNKTMATSTVMCTATLITIIVTTAKKTPVNLAVTVVSCAVCWPPGEWRVAQGRARCDGWLQSGFSLTWIGKAKQQSGLSVLQAQSVDQNAQLEP